MDVPCYEDLVADKCNFETSLLLSEAIVKDYTNSTCYTWMCPTSPGEPPETRAHAWCRLNKKTGDVLCPTRESGAQFACPARMDGDSIIILGDGRRTDMDLNFPADEVCPSF